MGSSRSTLFGGSSIFNYDKDAEGRDERREKCDAKKDKRLPIINPLVRLPSWPSK